MFCSMSVPVLRPAAAGRDPRASVETQHYGLCDAIHDTSDERVHREGTAAALCIVLTAADLLSRGPIFKTS